MREKQYWRRVDLLWEIKISIPFASGKIKSDGCLFTLYFDYSRKNIDREIKFK